MRDEYVLAAVWSETASDGIPANSWRGEVRRGQRAERTIGPSTDRDAAINAARRALDDSIAAGVLPKLPIRVEDAL